MKEIVGLVAIMLWMAGVVLAKGFWSVALAICFPPYALYQITEKIMILLGLVSA